MTWGSQAGLPVVPGLAFFDEEIMKISHVGVRAFRTTVCTTRDTDGHTHPGPEREATSAVLSIGTDDGADGHVICPVAPLRKELLEAFVKPVLMGQDPYDRERLWHGMAGWQRGSGGMLNDKTLGYVDQALWDLAGRALGLPVYKLIGAFRDKVPAYGSTMCGDDLENGLATADDYGRFASWLVEERGYQAVKLHTWMPPVPGAPSVAMDIDACTAVRKAVGPSVPLMLDANHWYSRTEALALGRAIQDLGYYWYEEPMEEASMSSYKWMADNLDIPVLGPESMEGKHFTRAEWAMAGACDILRTGVNDVGGLTPALKCVRFAESMNMDCEIHGGGAGNLQLLGAMRNGRWYERGLLHPFTDYERVPPHMNGIVDPMDQDGFVALPSRPGLGQDINFKHIDANIVDRW